MAAYWLPIFFFTLIWGIVGGVLPWFVPNGPHKQLIQVHIFIGLKKSTELLSWSILHNKKKRIPNFGKQLWWSRG